jgi:hypothetical protein
MTLARNMLLGCGAALVLAGFASTASAEDAEIRIVNLTRGQIFSPVIAWSHNKQFEPFFEFGEQASDELRAIAEDGNAGPMETLLTGDGTVGTIAIAGGPIPPGGEVVLTVDISGGNRAVSLASMLVNTNDTFFALRGAEVRRAVETFFQPGLDAGTEDNNEDCAFIPGPACASEEGNIDLDDDGEGFIFVQEGIHGQSGGVASSDLNPAELDWRNPVAYIEISRK